VKANPDLVQIQPATGKPVSHEEKAAVDEKELDNPEKP
jgi:hypothetical protein